MLFLGVQTWDLRARPAPSDPVEAQRAFPSETSGIMRTIHLFEAESIGRPVDTLLRRTTDSMARDLTAEIEHKRSQEDVAVVLPYRVWSLWESSIVAWRSRQERSALTRRSIHYDPCAVKGHNAAARSPPSDPA